MIQMFISILVVALSLYLTVFIHEWTHYLVAKKLGIPTGSLNLGVGPVILSHKGKLEINIRLMPIGGYLDIPDMTFFKETKLKRSHRCLIALAGPAGNLVLCFYLAVILAIFGIPVYSSSLTVGYVSTNYPSLNIKPGDKVVMVNGKKPKNWNFILGETYATDSTNITMVVLRGEERITNEVPIILPNLVTPKLPLSPEQQLVRRPAPMVNQHIVMVDGSTNFNGDTFAFAMRHDKPVLVTYMQDHHMHKEEWRVNEPLLYSLWEVNPPIIYDNPLTILGGTTWMMGKSILEIIVPKTNLRLENMSGPLTTMLYLHRFFYTDIRLGLFLVLALNIDLVMFNLIPIYPMDGSHVVSALLNKRPKWLGSYKTCMYFATWMVLLLLTWMLILDVIKFNIL
jgi:membrane-associated protease RseP (regulator of RpoE activity)